MSGGNGDLDAALDALALNDPRAPAVDRHRRERASAGETLHAPELLRYEAADALARAVVAGHLARDRAVTAWEGIARVEVQLTRRMSFSLSQGRADRLARAFNIQATRRVQQRVAEEAVRQRADLIKHRPPSAEHMSRRVISARPRVSPAYTRTTERTSR